MKDLGFGVIAVKGLKSREPEVKTHVMGKRVTSHPLPRIIGKLRPEQKTWAPAGTPGAAGRWTPFRQTRTNLYNVVITNPGIELLAAIKMSGHHYASDASARTCLLKLILAGVITEVRVEKQDRKIKLFPTAE